MAFSVDLNLVPSVVTDVTEHTKLVCEESERVGRETELLSVQLSETQETARLLVERVEDQPVQVALSPGRNVAIEPLWLNHGLRPRP